MKFEEKYELLESLTSGKVETFVANDKLRGERVVVHILHCDAQKPNQPTVQWVLDSFRRVAPEPAGLVLETGRYGGTLYAYLVTKMPDKAVLRGWVQQYNVQAKDTQELLIPEAKPEAQTDTATAEIPPEIKPAAPVRDISPEIKPAEPARVPVQFTQVFREFESHATPSAPSAPAKEPELPLGPAPDLSVPNLPLPNLGAAENPSGLRAAPAWDAGAPTPLVPPKQEPKFSSPVAPARADVPVQSFPAPPPSPQWATDPRRVSLLVFSEGRFTSKVRRRRPLRRFLHPRYPPGKWNLLGNRWAPSRRCSGRSHRQSSHCHLQKWQEVSRLAPAQVPDRAPDSPACLLIRRFCRASRHLQLLHHRPGCRAPSAITR